MTHAGHQPGTIAVIGATGQQGGAVASALLERGADVRALVRDPHAAKSQALAARGARLVRADLNDPELLASALESVDTLFAMTTFAEGGPAAEVRQGMTIAAAARNTGVARIVYSSVGGADRGTGIPHFESKWAIEQELRTLPAELTVIRPVFFMNNLTHGALEGVNDKQQILRFPLKPGVPLQMIAVADIGIITATAILDRAAVPAGHIEIGADELTPEQIAETITTATGIATQFEPVDIDAVIDDDQRAMFEWFTDPAYDADFRTSATLSPSLRSFAEYAADAF